jgi:hypothetical protein
MYYVNLLDEDGHELASMSDISTLTDAKSIAKLYLKDAEYKDSAHLVEVRNHGTMRVEWDKRAELGVPQ